MEDMEGSNRETGDDNDAGPQPKLAEPQRPGHEPCRPHRLFAHGHPSFDNLSDDVDAFVLRPGLLASGTPMYETLLTRRVQVYKLPP
jgi:hypothetical protein